MNTEHPQRLSPTDVANHLACTHRTQLERKRRAGELDVAFTPDARLAAMRERGRLHEQAYVDQLGARGLRIVDLTSSRDAGAALAAMRSGADVIVQAPLGSQHFRGVADVLLRTDAPSSLGPWSYEPVDTKLAADTKAGALLQLLTYCELLEGMQGVRPERFRVVTPQAEETYRTADFAAYFRVIRDHLRAAHTTTPPPATYPEPVPHCDVCNYWQYCDKRRRDDDHPSLVAGAGRRHVRELQDQGLPTVTALAAAGGLPAKPSRGQAVTYEQLAHQAQLQVAARTTNTIPVERLPVEPGRGLAKLPEPSPGDVFLDFEGDPFVGANGLEYLTGFGHVDDNGLFAYEQLWALDPAAEKQALQRFLDFVAGRLAEHPDLHVYHFGAYEVAALRRLCSRHDTHGDVLDMLLRGERFVDLHRVVKEGLRIGIEGYGLKEIEPVIGFERQLDLREAGVARRDLELSLELQRGEIADELCQKVAAYNEDDCRATVALRDWVERQRAAAIAAGNDVPRPELRDGEAQAAVRERDARVQTLRDALLDGLPPEADRDEEQRARALLADLVGYFRREVKSTWWEHFRLRDLPPEEHHDEREVLAGLEHVRIVPKQGRQKLDRDEFRFPPQDCAVDDTHDSLVFTRAEDPALEGTGTIVTIDEIDFPAGTITLALPEAALGARPTALFRKPFIPPDDVENAMLSLGEQVSSRGFTGVDHGPALDLLLRRPPRFAAPMPMRLDGESSTDALVRLCRGLDGGVLPVQGPPGTGKSHCGARGILELVGDGKRVGVVAVSHKVIDNLLVKVLEAAQEHGGEIAVTHVDRSPGDKDIPRSQPGKALSALANGNVVGGTVHFWAKPTAAAQLDYLFVDEAGQISLAQLLAIARCAKNLVLLGDPQQLEQPHKGTHPDGADVAALTYLIGVDRHTLADDQGLFLGETWRLAPPLCSFTSELYYDGRLHPRADLTAQRLGGTGLVDGQGHVLLECEHHGNQAQSREEVTAVHGLLQRVLVPGATWTDRHGEVHRLTATDVLVIAPYNAQVAALRRALAPLGVTQVGTVDKFQGQEAPLVIYSCTSSSPEDAPRGLAFLYDPHRLNVATSRAKCAFVMVASPRLFRPDVRTPEQMRMANGMCRFREVARRVEV